MTEHVVSVIPKVGYTEEGDSYTYYRALCTCRHRSVRAMSMERGERYAREHLESVGALKGEVS